MDPRYLLESISAAGRALRPARPGNAAGRGRPVLGGSGQPGPRPGGAGGVRHQRACSRRRGHWILANGHSQEHAPASLL